MTKTARPSSVTARAALPAARALQRVNLPDPEDDWLPGPRSAQGRTASAAASEPLADPTIVESERESVHTQAASFLSNRNLWLASFVALGTADFGALASAGASSLLALEGLGVAGGTGLIVTSAKDLKRTTSTEEKLDAANNIAWGGQGLMYLFPGSTGALELGLGLGLVGSAMQTAVGLMRVQRGLVRSDRSMIKLGALDVGGGLLWLGWDLLGIRQPLFVGAYILAKAGREAYVGRKTLTGLLGAIKQKAQRGYREAASVLESAWREFEAGYDAGYEAG